MADSASVVSQMQSVLSTGGDKVIGALVYWTLGGVRVRRDDVRQQLTALGLGEAVGRDPRPEAVLAKAAGRAQLGRKDVLIRRIDKYTWAVLGGEAIDQATGQLKLEHAVTVRVSTGLLAACSANIVNQDVPETTLKATMKAADAMMQAYEDADQFMDTAELSEVVVAAMHGSAKAPMLAGLSLRERSGGLYYCPSSTVKLARDLADWIHTRSFGQFVVLTLHGDDENLKAASMAAKASFANQLRELREEVWAFADAQKAAGKAPTAYSVDVRAARLKALGDRVELFSDVLGSVAAELTASITNARQDLAKELGL